MSPELRHAVRRLVRTPGLVLLALLTLGVGLGTSAAIFSVVHALLLRDLPVNRPHELLNLYHSTPEISHSLLSYPDLVEIERRPHKELAPRDLVESSPSLGVSWAH